MFFPAAGSRSLITAVLAAGDGNARAKADWGKVHTVFSTECVPYFDWQSLGLVYSFNKVCSRAMHSCRKQIYLDDALP